MNESNIPIISTRMEMTAEMARAVIAVRLGARTMFLNGICHMVGPGSFVLASSHAGPPAREARCPVLMASIGETRTARHTGTAVAAKGIRKPSAAAPYEQVGAEGRQPHGEREEVDQDRSKRLRRADSHGDA